jgi:hypothetical protein
MKKALSALSAILDKAAQFADSKKTSNRTFEHTLINSRLVFDQFSLGEQVQRISDSAKGGAARLAGIDVPSYEDTEKTFAELKARIEKTRAFLDTISPDMVAGQEERKIELSYFPGKHMTGFGYATEHVMPNFYFHLTTAYSILRTNGMNIGKTDFIGGLPLLDN